MTKTEETLTELRRCVRKLTAYQDATKEGRHDQVTHAEAERATMDATHALACWRKTPTSYQGTK